LFVSASLFSLGFVLFAGIYSWLFETFSSSDGSPPGFFMKAAMGMAAGATGAFVGTPAEVNMIVVCLVFLHLAGQRSCRRRPRKTYLTPPPDFFESWSEKSDDT
jgi:hypothetical protein